MVHTYLGWIVSLAVFATATSSGDAAAAPVSAYAHVRSSVAALRALVTQGVRVSPTFGALVADIERSDVVVYLTQEPQKHGIRAHISFMGSAGGRRYVRMSVAPNIVAYERLALFGHEFQHV